MFGNLIHMNKVPRFKTSGTSAMNLFKNLKRVKFALANPKHHKKEKKKKQQPKKQQHSFGPAVIVTKCIFCLQT